MESLQVFVRWFFTVWYFTFGNAISLTVLPEGPVVAPDLFILRPVPPPDQQPDVNTRLGPDVCLAANFRPPGGVMFLETSGGPSSLNTSTAVLSIQHKTYFFTGFSDHNIQSCKLNDSFQSLAPGTATVPATVPATAPATVPATALATVPAPVPENEPCNDCYPERAKLNFYLLLFNGIRVVFIKAVAVSTILTIRAVLV